MASKDNKTSKTARVMNLLSKKPDPASADGTADAAPAPAAPVPPIVTSMAPDAAVSVQIKNALEDALADELGPQQAEPPVQPQPTAEAAPPAQQPAAEPEPPVQPAAEPAPQPAPVAGPSAPVQQEEAPADQAALDVPHFEEPLVPENPGYMNVMQVLVEEKAPKYIKMFGLCTCERCLEDVKAYTLNHLPPKYVVLERGDMIPRLTVYEGQFSSDITAQLLQACKVVTERPHHSR